ncbi:MAG: ATP-dependent DNA helicase [Desulfitobacteriia bacterium]
MEKPIVILSVVPPQITGKQWHFAALRIEKNRKPRYLLFTRNQAYLTSEDKNRDRAKVKEFIINSNVFVRDSDTVTHCLNLLDSSINLTQLIEVKEILAIFYPFLSKHGLPEAGSLFVQRIKYRSPAHKEVREIWKLLKTCFAIGLNFDVGYLNNLEEHTKGLACGSLITALRRQIIKQFPDRPIRTGLNLNEEGFNLFTSEAEVQAEHIPESPEWVRQCFQKGGLLSKNLAGYEDRAVQSRMAEAVIEGFTQARNYIIEAGTGTGKTLAYLIPALWWARKNKSRVIIATYTITLQEQLFYKDLPFLQKILPFKTKGALLKGKNNYVCLQSFYQDKPDDKLPKNEKLVKAGIFTWLSQTISGDFSEIAHLQNISGIWKKYGADNPYCQPNECQFASRCFMLKARKRAEEADLIVINHSLLLADIKTKNKILPEYNDLIIDEAHNIYQTALKQLGFAISREQMASLTDRISGKKGSLHHSLQKNRFIWAQIYPLINWSEFDTCLKNILDVSLGITEQTNELFAICQEILQGRLNLRIDEVKLGEGTYAVFTVAIENLLNRLAGLIDVLNKLYNILAVESEQLDRIRLEILRNKSDLELIYDGLQVIVSDNSENMVTYLENNNGIYLKNTVVDIAPILKEWIFSKINCTVLTSATLTVADSFAYFARDTGIDNYLSLKLKSPFDYSQQMLFSIVNDLQVQKIPEGDLAVKTANFISRIAEVMNGRTLILFTSHRYLRLVYSHLTQEMAASRLNILAQRINGSREVLLQEFMKNKQSILLGTSSFWEGIDLPGEALRCVIMTKLPFWPPDTPVLEAKANLLAGQGYDPFQDLHLPEAIIRFKQGFGRLIRTQDDKGVVILLDDRILHKYYGKFFLKSLPIISYFRGSAASVLEQVGYWV